MRDPIRPILRDRRAQTAALVALFLLIPALATAAERRPEPRSSRAIEGERAVDVRRGERVRRSPARRAAQDRLRDRLGRGGVLEVDPATAAPRRVARVGGFLTSRRRARARDIALGFLGENRAAFGLDSDDLAGFSVSREYRLGRLAHVELRQSHRGIPAYDNGLVANVVDGRLLNLSGLPVPDLSVRSVNPRLGATQAVEKLVGSRRARGRRANLAIFAGPDGNRLVWEVIAAADSRHTYHAAVDAGTGEVLQRSNLTKHASGRALDYRPGLDRDGVPGADGSGTYGPLKTFPPGWVTGSADRLQGDFAHTYSDVDDGSDVPPKPELGQEVAPSSGSGDVATATWDHPTTFGPPGTPSDRTCPASPTSSTNGCTWNGFGFVAPFTAGNNWERNREANATQVHYFVNRFHDHLLGAPGIGFNAASGNFEGTDRIHAQTDDGANSGAPGDPGFPDSDHVNNANMTTLPEGSPPTMQMYLYTSFPSGDENDVNGGDDAAVVYHEYVHGLSGRLVTGPGGVQALSGLQAAAMGEAWSDWYMFDFLNAPTGTPPGTVYQADPAADGDLVQGDYEGSPFVTEASDCAVNAVSTQCPQGGYTYADYAKVVGFPEEHADGEIWTQTLWQLRARLIGKYGTINGINRARLLITSGMRLSGPEPDFLDMRDSIKQADSSLSGSADAQVLREVFAARGMGACAATEGTNDSTPTADFRVNTPAGGCLGAASPPPAAGGAPSTPATPKLLSDIGFGGFPRRASLRTALRRGLAGRISCNADCTFRASLVLPRRSARRAGFRGRTVVVSRVRLSDAAGGSGRRVRFKFTRSVARKLRRLTRGTALELRVSAVDSRGARRSEKKKLTLKR